MILDRIALPDAAAMAKDIALWQQREESLKDAFEQIDYQKDYIVELDSAVDYAPCDWDMTVALFKEWEHDKERSILGYRNKSFTSPCTGTKAPIHHTPWVEAMDDSMTDFLAEKVLLS